jgi:mRNA interferase MazF
VKRGEVWWADLPAPAGRRPVVLLSRDAAYAVRTAVTIAPVTRTIRDIPVEVHLGREDGLPARCVVNLDDVTTIPKSLLRERISSLSTVRIAEVDGAIRFALDLP